ncbi:hypothetical protein, partial [Segatella sp.]|uniref:hypothetical protein n=1 Tax=Segatella sp. TaxID=2974253 RepID=UPI00307E3FAA
LTLKNTLKACSIRVKQGVLLAPIAELPPAFKICEFPPNRPSVLEFANFGGLFLPPFPLPF